MECRRLVKRESKFLTELKKSFWASGAFFYKISDSFHGGAMRFDAPKPFDAFGCHKGVPMAIEAKAMTDYKAFGKTYLRDCQVKGLTEWSDAGGKSFVFLNIRRGPKDGVKRVNRLFIFPWEVIGGISRNMKKSEIESWPYIEGKKGLFDLSNWLDAL